MNYKEKILNRYKAFLLAIIAIFTIIPFSLFTVSASKDDGSPIIVSMGDSFSSGEGVEKFYDQDKSLNEKLDSHDWLAHRSENSWPGQLMFPGLEEPLSKYRVHEGNPNGNWYFVASSGAETKHIEGSQEKKYNRDDITHTTPLPPQIEILDKIKKQGDTVDYITITIGGNDVQFANIVKQAAIEERDYFDKSGLRKKLNTVWADFFMKNGVRSDILKAYQNIHNAAPEATIIVAGYPKLLDQNGKGVWFNKEEAQMINTDITKFNKEIEKIVKEANEDGIDIHFVSVEDKFNTHEVSSSNPYLNGIYWREQSQDLESGWGKSAYSVHPNLKGIEVYRDCVQDKIDNLPQKDNSNNSEENDSHNTDYGNYDDYEDYDEDRERDVVLVLDTSGSMDGEPLLETKESAKKFVDTVLNTDANVAIVNYDSDVSLASNFTNNQSTLDSAIDSLYSGSMTDIEDGLKTAHGLLNLSNAEKKIIVLMSDGLANEGLTGDDLINYAEEIKNDKIYIYTLGFFSSLSDYDKTDAQRVMDGIANKGCHFEVSDAESLKFFFEDIADQITGQNYIYIRIACPVDVTVEYDGETLDSSEKHLNTRTSFGSLTFEEIDEDEDENEDSYDNSYNGSYNYNGLGNSYNNSYSNSYNSYDEEDEREDQVKILRLKEGVKYDIKIEGYDKGKMDYSIGFMDEEGEYSDFREFNNIKITKKTEIDTVAEVSDSTTLKVDEDGDGSYDYVYKAKENGEGELVEENYTLLIIIIVLSCVLVLLIVIIVAIKVKKRKKTNIQ